MSVCVSVAMSHCDRPGQTGMLPPQPPHSGTQPGIVAMERGSTSVMHGHCDKCMESCMRNQENELYKCVMFLLQTIVENSESENFY